MRKTTFIYLFTALAIAACNYSPAFNKEVWLNNPEVGDTSNPRARMVEDLMRNHLKRGMSRKAVLNLLGNPYKEGVEQRLPKGVVVPDSISQAFIESTPENSQKATDRFNEFYQLHSQPDTLMLYPVGWSTIDPNFLVVKLTGTGVVGEYWAEQH